MENQGEYLDAALPGARGGGEAATIIPTMEGRPLALPRRSAVRLAPDNAKTGILAVAIGSGHVVDVTIDGERHRGQYTARDPREYDAAVKDAVIVCTECPGRSWRTAAEFTATHPSHRDLQKAGLAHCTGLFSDAPASPEKLAPLEADVKEAQEVLEAYEGALTTTKAEMKKADGMKKATLAGQTAELRSSIRKAAGELAQARAALAKERIVGLMCPPSSV